MVLAWGGDAAPHRSQLIFAVIFGRVGSKGSQANGAPYLLFVFLRFFELFWTVFSRKHCKHAGKISLIRNAQLVSKVLLS